MKIAYAHTNKNSIAVDLPKKKILESMATNLVAGMFLSVGISFIHPKDKLVKSIGRDVATKSMKLTMIFLTSIKTHEDGRTIYHFQYDNETPTKRKLGLTTHLGFSTVDRSENVHLEYAFVDFRSEPEQLPDSTSEQV